jgi:hypothetical protein
LAAFQYLRKNYIQLQLAGQLIRQTERRAEKQRMFASFKIV